MATCPPKGQTQFDIRKAVDCVAVLRELHDAYVQLITGNKPIELRFNERWTTYNKGNQEALLTLYMTYWNQCPRAAQAGLPDLNPNKAVRRGSPANNVNMFWKRF